MSVSACSGRLPATKAGVELALVWAFVGIRAFDLAQAAVALAAGSLLKSSDPSLDIGLVIAVTAESILLGWGGGCSGADPCFRLHGRSQPTSAFRY